MTSSPPTQPPGSGLRRRWVLLAAVCMAVLAAAAVLLPLRLLSLPRPAHAPTVTKPATSVARRAPRPIRGDAPQQPVVSSSQPASAPVSPPESEPIIEYRRARTDVPLRETTIPGALASAPPASRTEDLDRSPEARRRGVQQFGGTPRTESAVEAGLAWLAAHQMRDGLWDRLAFQNKCPADDRCPGPALRRTDNSLQAGLTGLSLLAFLGAGYTDRAGPYRDVVRRAVEALLRAQQADGGFATTEAMAGYNDTLATFALAEYYAMTREPRLREPLRRAVARLVLTQQELGGWDYLPRRDSGRNDTSITAWAVQALQTCAVAGIEVPRRVLAGAALHFARATETDGRVWYADTGTGFDLDAQTLQPVYRYGPAMTAAGLTCEQLLGWRIDSPICRKQQALLMSQLPSSDLARGRDPTQLHNEYYWYYGTAAMFQSGGDHWQRWNARLRDTLLPLQDRRHKPGAGKRHSFGSWPPYGPQWGKWGRMGGRVYTTALCALTLEIYYRHTPAYLKDHLVLTAEDWRRWVEESRPRARRLAVRCLRETRFELAEPVLVELLQDSNRKVALAAAEALASIDSPLGRKRLEEALPKLSAMERPPFEQALRRAVAIEALPPVTGRVRMVDPTHHLATVELPRAYVGMELTIQRDGREVARLRVIRRYSGRTVVLAERIGAPTGDTPRAGDTVAGR